MAAAFAVITALMWGCSNGRLKPSGGGGGAAKPPIPPLPPGVGGQPMQSGPPPATGTGPPDAGMASVQDAGAPPTSLPGTPMGACAVAAGTADRKAFTPKLFSKGMDASGEADCTAINPERGFFVGRNLRELTDADLPRGTAAVVYGEAVLADYLDRDLDPAVLTEITAGFQAARRTGFKVVPRFYYAAAAGEPEPTIDRVIAHITQLTPILRNHTDVIVAMQAGFLGYWGEWHREAESPAADRQRVLEALLGALPPSRMIQVRRPSYKQAAFGGPLTAAEAFTGTSLARLGHVNDCFLSADNDAGTYGSEAERMYALADAQFTPMGGQICELNPRTACATALPELERFRFSFINGEHDPMVMQGWRTEGCMPAIACRLGYRLVVRAHETPREARRGQPLNLTLELSNDGYARAFNPRPVALVLIGATRVVLPSNVDARAFGPGDHQACLTVQLPANLPAGQYQLGLALLDPMPTLTNDPRYAVRLGGGVTWDATSGVNLLDAKVTVAE